MCFSACFLLCFGRGDWWSPWRICAPSMTWLYAAPLATSSSLFMAVTVWILLQWREKTSHWSLREFWTTFEWVYVFFFFSFSLMLFTCFFVRCLPAQTDATAPAKKKVNLSQPFSGQLHTSLFWITVVTEHALLWLYLNIFFHNQDKTLNQSAQLVVGSKAIGNQLGRKQRTEYLSDRWLNKMPEDSYRS